MTVTFCLKISDTIQKIQNSFFINVQSKTMLDFRRHKMNEANYWKQFFCTGKVEDYLKYKQCRDNETQKHEENSRVKEEPYAGFYHSDRDSH